MSVNSSLVTTAGGRRHRSLGRVDDVPEGVEPVHECSHEPPENLNSVLTLIADHRHDGG